jgi:hypothetical protein
MTEGSASVTWGKIKKKLTDEDVESSGVAPKTPGTGETKAKKTPAKRKSTVGDENGESPSKKPRAKKAKTPIKGKDSGEEENEAPAATPAKKKAAKTPAKGKEGSGEEDSIEVPAATPATKKAVPKKKVIKAEPESPQVSSDETAHENTNGDTTMTNDTAKDTTIEVDATMNDGEDAVEANAS